MKTGSGRSVYSRLANVANANRALLSSSSSLLGSTLVTSMLGFAYWWLAARLYPAEVVGTASAATSALTLLSTIGTFGLGTLLIGELAADRSRARQLLPSVLIAATALATLLGVVFVAGVLATDSGLRSSFKGTFGEVLLVTGVALSAAALVFDQATIALGVGSLQLRRNTVFAAVKLLLVPLVLVLLNATHDVLLLTWVLGTAVSLVVVAPKFRRRAGLSLVGGYHRKSLHGLGRTALQHNALNLTLSIPRLAMPVVVAAFLPGEPTAAFYAAWMLAGFLYIVPTHFSTAMFAIAAGDRTLLRRNLRIALLLSGVGGGAAVAVVSMSAPLILGLFGPGYARLAAPALTLLAIQYFPQALKQYWVAVQRVERRMPRAAAATSLGGLTELLAVGVGCALGSLTLAAALLGAVLAVEAALMLPSLIRTLRLSEGD